MKILSGRYPLFRKSNPHPLIKKLLATGLFSKIGSDAVPKYLKLNQTNYCVIPVFNKSGKDLIVWYSSPKGASFDNLNFFAGRAADTLLSAKNIPREVSFQEVFDNSPQEIKEKINSEYLFLKEISVRI